ncbi:MAG: hypothetical protein AAGG75_06600 [Bacteroidota bacterium]
MKNSSYLFPLLLLLLFAACKKETQINKQPVVDNYIYEINGEKLYQSNAEKVKQKSAEQYISILYANLNKQSIPQNDLSQLAEIRLANGDKQMADELILNGFVNSPSISIPTDAEMRADIEGFIQQTFLRFFLREPTAYETFEIKKAIEEDPDMTPVLVYQAFALSNEYKFY